MKKYLLFIATSCLLWAGFSFLDNENVNIAQSDDNQAVIKALKKQLFETFDKP